MEIEAAVADTFRRRLSGLAWLREPPPLALLIPRCASVHTAGMRFALDLVFLAWTQGDPGARVLAVRERVGPLRTASVPRPARPARPAGVATLELSTGRAAEAGFADGARLAIVAGTAA